MSTSFAQNNITSSPYSLFGIGDPLSLNNTMGLSMGDVKYAMSQPFYLNYANPASYGSLMATTFSLGAMLNRTRSFNATTTQDNDNGTLRYFGLGIPLTKKLGIAIGARPFTSLGYGIQIDSDIQYPSTVSTRYEGEGGLNIAYGGIGFTILKDSVQTLNLGVNANLYFGNNKQTALNLLNNSNGALSSMYLSSYVASDFGFDIGFMYTINMNQLFHTTGNTENKFTLGGTYTVPTDINTTFEYFAGSFYQNNSIYVITDTLEYEINESSIYLPQRFGIGLSYQMFNRHTKAHILVEADYESNSWSELKINNQETSLNNSSRYSFGIQFTPDATGIRDILKLLRYRVGFNYRESRINLNGYQLNDMSASFGFGIPLVKSKSIYPSSSSIDFGILVGQRGTTDNSFIREQYTNFYIGLSFSPNYWDRWFKKRKIN